MAGFRKVGDWKRVGALVKDLGPNIKRAQELSLKRWGLKAEGLAKTHISKQDLDWRPLSPRYLSSKVQKGYSENILVASSSYFQSITSYVDGDTVYAGVRRGVMHKDGEVELGKLAAVHEFGSDDGRIPARPLWQPTFAEVSEWHFKFNSPLMHLAKLLERY